VKRRIQRQPLKAINFLPTCVLRTWAHVSQNPTRLCRMQVALVASKLPVGLQRRLAAAQRMARALLGVR
jgi:hypothetical protein